jgi:hypothetical protein
MPVSSAVARVEGQIIRPLGSESALTDFIDAGRVEPPI